MKKIYNLSYADGFEMRVEIDHSILTEEKAHELNNFWSGARERVLEHGSALNAVMVMLCVEFMSQIIEVMDPVGAFNSGRIEGWPPLDGSWGIRLVTHDHTVFMTELVEIHEVAS